MYQKFLKKTLFFIFSILKMNYFYCSVVSTPDFFLKQISSVKDIEQIEESIIKGLQISLENLLKYKDVCISGQNLSEVIQGVILDGQKIEKSIEKNISLLHLYNLVGSESYIKDKINESLVKVSSFINNNFSYNKDLYLIYKSLYKEIKENASITLSIFKNDVTLLEETKKFLKDTLDSYQRNGILLSLEKQDRLKKVSVELGTLGQDFALNIQKVNDQVVVSRDELEGISDEQLSKLLQDKDGGYILEMNYPVRELILTYCKNRDVRKKFFEKFAARAYPENEAILDKIRLLASEKADLLGYSNYAEYDLEKSMAGSVESASKMMESIHQVTYKKALEEKKEIERFVKNELFDKDFIIEPWDAAYINQEYIKKYLNIDKEEVSKYFPAKQVLKRLFGIYEKFFDIKIKQVEYKNSDWKPAPDVFLVRVFENDEKTIIGDIIFDLYPRKNKYSHACAGSIVSALKDSDDEFPISIIIANLNKPTKDRDALLLYSDVKTLFHEFGHALHGIFGKTFYGEYSGTNTKIDFVELPSQLFEEWLCNKEVLKNLSSHYKTGEALPDDLVEKLIKSKKHNIGLFFEGQLAFSQISLGMYSNIEQSISDIVKNAFERTISISSKKQDAKFCSAFTHFPANSYGAKYYSYTWSLILVSNFTSYIEENGGFLNSSIGKRLRDLVLSKGGSIDPNVLIQDFLGRETSFEKFLAYLH